MFGGDGELAVDRQDQSGVQFSRAHQLRNVCDVHEKERLEQLRDDLVRADEQHHFPFRPVTDAIHAAEDDAEKNDLPAEPQDFDDHPQEEIRLETHLANERVAQHDGVDFDVTPHCFFLSLSYRRSQLPLE